MSEFAYEALDRDGGTVRGRVEAESEREAREKIRKRGLYVVETAAVPQPRPRAVAKDPRPSVEEPPLKPMPAPEPPPPAPQQVVVVAQSNGLGTAGFVTSLLGLLLTCGLLCPLGLLLSFLALFRPPRGMALAGILLGFVGSYWLFLVGGGLLLMLAGMGSTVNERTERKQERTLNAREIAQRDVDRLTQLSANFAHLRLRVPITMDDLAEVAKGPVPIVDPWGRNYSYARYEDKLKAMSLGPDGKPDTEDDILSENYFRVPAEPGEERSR